MYGVHKVFVVVTSARVERQIRAIVFCGMERRLLLDLRTFLQSLAECTRPMIITIMAKLATLRMRSHYSNGTPALAPGRTAVTGALQSRR